MRMVSTRTLIILPLFVLSILLPCAAVGQRVIVNSQGDRVIVYPDGSSRLANPRDSLLVKQYLQQGMPEGTSTESNANGKSKNVAEQQDFLLRQWQELFNNILAEEKITQENFRTATNAQFKASEQLENAEANKKLIEPDQLATLHDQYESSVNDLRKAKHCSEEMKKIVEKAQKIDASPAKLTSKKLDKTKSGFNLFRAECNPGGKVTVIKAAEIPSDTPSNNPEISKPITSSSTSAVSTSTISTAATYSLAYDPGMVNKRPSQYDYKAYLSEPFDCQAEVDTVDLATGRRRIELRPSLLFTHTDPDLRPYFKDKDLITCYGRLSKIGPYIYLTVNFHIASSHSQNNFGLLQEGSLFRLKLFDGEFVSLYNIKADKGHIDPYSGHTIFTGQYALGKTEIKKISHAELDKIRVLWGTGYEDYEVYHMDILIKQINCLLAKK